jgi:hypothetical protein
MSIQDESALVQNKSIRDWATEIDVEWRKSVKGIISTGRLISKALAEIPHGQKAEFYDILPFTQQTCNKLVQIGEDARISIYAHGSSLPSSWTTLYELTKLDDDTWELAEEEGRIFSDMQRKDVKLLQATGNQTQPKSKPVKSLPRGCNCTSEIFEIMFQEYFEVIFEWESDGICMEATWTRSDGWKSPSDNTFLQDLDGASNIVMTGRKGDDFGNIQKINPINQHTSDADLDNNSLNAH